MENSQNTFGIAILSLDLYLARVRNAVVIGRFGSCLPCFLLAITLTQNFTSEC